MTTDRELLEKWLQVGRSTVERLSGEVCFKSDGTIVKVHLQRPKERERFAELLDETRAHLGTGNDALHGVTEEQ